MSLLRIIMMTALTAGALAPAAGRDINYLHLYLVGEAAPGGWDAGLPEELTRIDGTKSFVWDGWLKKGQFKFINVRGDYNSSFTATVCDNEAVDNDHLKEFKLNWNGNDNGISPHEDWKFYNDYEGHCRIVVDLGSLTMKFRRPNLAIVGDAALGWSGPFEQILYPVYANDEGLIHWDGQLQQGTLKFLATGDDWFPCFNAPWQDDLLGAGTHQLVYNTADKNDQGEFVDFTYRVPRAGLYHLEFDFANNSVSVSTKSEPELYGAFTSAPGRYVLAVDQNSRRLHFGPVPQRLYVRSLGGNTQELSANQGNRFKASVWLDAGDYYKLCYDTEDSENTAFSPNADTDITRGTSYNVAPMHGYSYTVPQSGNYDVTVDFSGTAPSISAVRNVPSSIAGVADSGLPTVTVNDRVIEVGGTFGSVVVCGVSGQVLGRTARTAVEPGVYVVKVDSHVFKVAVP